VRLLSGTQLLMKCFPFSDTIRHKCRSIFLDFQ